jgi:hypothetical protein
MSQQHTPAADHNDPPPAPCEGRIASATINLDDLDLSGLLAHAESLLAGLEDYQRYGEAGGFDYDTNLLMAVSTCKLAAHAAVTELTRLGLELNPPTLITIGTRERSAAAVLGFREWLFKWGGGPNYDTHPLPDLARPLGKLREIVSDLRRTSAPADGTGGAPPRARAKEAAQRVDKLSLAIALLRKHPDWSDRKIASEVECSGAYLSQKKEWRAARKVIKGLGQESQHRDRRHRGHDMDQYAD